MIVFSKAVPSADRPPLSIAEAELPIVFSEHGLWPLIADLATESKVGTNLKVVCILCDTVDKSTALNTFQTIHQKRLISTPLWAGNDLKIGASCPPLDLNSAGNDAR